ncbi:glutamine amidotransferase, partial [bacterium]|nr:glutamine amidotransferase [bacterium]
LGICGGYQLFGHYYQPFEGDKLIGISLMDAYTIAGKKRFIGNVTVETDFLSPKTLVGFENHSGLTFLQGETEPLGKNIVGNGNNGKDGFEGGRYKNVFGTYLHGSLLPKNPHFADYLIELALEKRYDEKFELQKLDDELENRTHNSLIGKAY